MVVAAKGKKKKKDRTPPFTDRHKLYEESVQSPGEHVEFFDRVYQGHNGRLPRLFKEDFCGTALLSAEWVKTRPDNQAIGVDLDAETLAWGKEHNIDPLGADAKRLTIHEADVRDIVDPKVDVLAALNFSYFIFKTRAELLKYFQVARQSIADDGMFVMDIFGGTESFDPDVTDRTRYDGWTYIWDQKYYDPITNHTAYAIHFKFHGSHGSMMRDAFVYEWRHWSIPEVKELLQEAGFSHVDIYWEDIDDETDEGNGEFNLVTETENSPGWIALMVARP